MEAVTAFLKFKICEYKLENAILGSWTELKFLASALLQFRRIYNVYAICFSWHTPERSANLVMAITQFCRRKIVRHAGINE